MCKSFSVLALCLASGFAGFLATGARAAEASRLTMAITSESERNPAKQAEISVHAEGGRYDRVTSTGLSLPLKLAGDLTAEAAGYKIVASELFLKAAGSGKDTLKADAIKGGAPVSAIDLNTSFDFEIEAQGPVAQNAIAACNGLPAAERSTGKAVSLTMSLPVVWRVTTGRFNFQWTNYDRVAPSDEIYNNRDFYADQQSNEAETTAEAKVTCQPLTVASAASVVTPHAKTEPKPSPIVPATIASPAPITTASLADTGKPECDGGIIRQLSSGEASYLCLCPGNTERVQSGSNSFTCEKKSRRR